MVELAAYVDGTDPVAEVLRLQAEREVFAVAVDPHSPAATVIRPLTDAGVEVVKLPPTILRSPTASFLDTLAAGRLRHVSDPRLDAAVRHGTARRLGGAAAWERRGSAVDVAPAVAAEIAVWALGHARRPYDLLRSIW